MSAKSTKGKSSTIPSDDQAKEKLALYVYEYLLHEAAHKAAYTFLSEIRWGKNITLGAPPGFLSPWWCEFWKLYCAAPERRENFEHSNVAKAFHDYNPSALSPLGQMPPHNGMPGGSMYAKSTQDKGSTVPSDDKAKEKLALYVYEYLLHIGAVKAAQTFLSEIRWVKNITLGESPGFLSSWWSVFWKLYCAAPERRENFEDSNEAKAFHDYLLEAVTSEVQNLLPNRNLVEMNAMTGALDQDRINYEMIKQENGGGSKKSNKSVPGMSGVSSMQGMKPGMQPMPGTSMGHNGNSPFDSQDGEFSPSLPPSQSTSSMVHLFPSSQSDISTEDSSVNVDSFDDWETLEEYVDQMPKETPPPEKAKETPKGKTLRKSLMFHKATEKNKTAPSATARAAACIEAEHDLAKKCLQKDEERKQKRAEADEVEHNLRMELLRAKIKLIETKNLIHEKILEQIDNNASCLNILSDIMREE